MEILLGKLKFTGMSKQYVKDLILNYDGVSYYLDEQLDKTNQSLEEASVPMPAFGDIKTVLAKEVGEPTEEESILLKI